MQYVPTMFHLFHCSWNNSQWIQQWASHKTQLHRDFLKEIIKHQYLFYDYNNATIFGNISKYACYLVKGHIYSFIKHLWNVINIVYYRLSASRIVICLYRYMNYIYTIKEHIAGTHLFFVPHLYHSKAAIKQKNQPSDFFLDCLIIQVKKGKVQTCIKILRP